MTSRDGRLERAGVLLLLLAPAASVIVLSFSSGGFFPGATGAAALVACAGVAARVALAPRPFAGMHRGLALVLVAMSAFAVWTLASAVWSDAPARAVIEYDRVLLYGAVLLLVGLLPRSRGRAETMVYGLAAATVGVAVAALLVWLLPDVLPVDDGFGRVRLSWPLGYWNATGLVAALGAVWCTHLTSTSRVPPAVRVLAAAAIPLMAAVVYFSVSRGAAAAGLLGIVVYAATARSRGLLTGVPTVAFGVLCGILVAAQPHGLAAPSVTGSALGGAHRALALLVVAALLTAAVRAVLVVRVEPRIARARFPALSPQELWMAGGAALLVTASLFVALGGPGAVSNSYHDFVSSDAVWRNLRPSSRFGRLENNGRIELWRIALDTGFAGNALHGSGAGTYGLQWDRERSDGELSAVDAHSLYVEQLSELGIVGFAILLAALLAIVVALARRSRGPGTSAWAALLAGVVVWAVHAGVDWDWEMPALTVWVFAAGGLALAARARDRDATPQPGPATPLRVLPVVACVGLALLPLAVVRSQRGVTDAVAALRGGDCARASTSARSARDALPARPEPYELLAYCAMRGEQPRAALSLIDQAVARDPGSWDVRYGRALVRAAAGRDPRAAAREALRRNPRSAIVQSAVRTFATGDRAAWRRWALSAPLPLPAGKVLPSLAPPPAPRDGA